MGGCGWFPAVGSYVHIWPSCWFDCGSNEPEDLDGIFNGNAGVRLCRYGSFSGQWGYRTVAHLYWSYCGWTCGVDGLCCAQGNDW